MNMGHPFGKLLRDHIEQLAYIGLAENALLMHYSAIASSVRPLRSMSRLI